MSVALCDVNAMKYNKAFVFSLLRLGINFYKSGSFVINKQMLRDVNLNSLIVFIIFRWMFLNLSQTVYA